MCGPKYTQQQKKRENLLLSNWLKIKYIELEKYILHVKLTVYYTVSFTDNIYFLNSTDFIFNHFKCNRFTRFFFFAVEYINASRISYHTSLAEYFDFKRFYYTFFSGKRLLLKQ